MVKIDTDKQGLEIVFKDWQVPLIQKLFSEEIKMSSKQAWDYINHEKSRASVIFFLNDCVEDGYLQKTFITGKGGHRGIFQRNMDTKEFWRYVSTKTKEALAPFI